MSRKKRDRCEEKIWSDYGTDSLAVMCGRPLPCLLHTPYQPEHPERTIGPRQATFAEKESGRVCRECLNAVEVHDNGEPTRSIRCTLHGSDVRPNMTCEAFTVLPVRIQRQAR